MIRKVLAAAVVVGLALAAWKVLDVRQLAEIGHRLQPAWLAPLLAVPVVYLLLKSYRFALLMAEVDGDLPLGVTMRAYASTQAATMIPGGFAARAAVLEDVDGRGGHAVGPTLATGLMDNLTFILAVLVAAAAYPQARLTALITGGAVAVGGVALAFPAVRRRSGRWLLALGDRLGCRSRVDDCLESLPAFLHARPLAAGAGLTLAAFALEAFALWASLAALRVDVPFGTAVLAWVVSITVGRLSPAPGGLGVTEAGMVGLMSHLSGASVTEAAAATLLFRVVTLFLPALLGTAVYLLAWRGRDEVPPKEAPVLDWAVSPPARGGAQRRDSVDPPGSVTSFS